MKSLLIRIVRIRHSIRLPHPANHTDHHLLQWCMLSLGVLLSLIVIVFCGLAGAADAWLHSALAQLPFYPEQQEQIYTVNPATVFLCTIAITLYGAAVLVHEAGLAARSLLCLLAGVVLALPSIICLLWGIVLCPGIPLLSIVLLWVYSTCIPYFRTATP